jgi:GntR family trehalose operon transcriptional repressor
MLTILIQIEARSESAMGSTKYDKIFNVLKEKIESGFYPVQALIPSEYALIEEYQCARNTVRRAIAALSAQGYVQSVHGKGVCVIYQPRRAAQYSFGNIESFKEASEKNAQTTKTKVILFTVLTVDEKLNARTSFPIGQEIYYVQRVRYLDGIALIIDHNFFRTDVVSGLTADICEGSVYDYIENELHQDIVTIKRTFTVERITALDEKHINLCGFNCMAVVSNQTYNADGIMFEFTQSRHHPEYFVFHDQAKRLKK